MRTLQCISQYSSIPIRIKKLLGRLEGSLTPHIEETGCNCSSSKNMDHIRIVSIAFSNGDPDTWWVTANQEHCELYGNASDDTFDRRVNLLCCNSTREVNSKEILPFHPSVHQSHLGPWQFCLVIRNDGTGDYLFLFSATGFITGKTASVCTASDLMYLLEVRTHELVQ